MDGIDATQRATLGESASVLHEILEGSYAINRGPQLVEDVDCFTGLSGKHATRSHSGRDRGSALSVRDNGCRDPLRSSHQIRNHLASNLTRDKELDQRAAI